MTNILKNLISCVLTFAFIMWIVLGLFFPLIIAIPIAIWGVGSLAIIIFKEIKDWL